MGCGQVKYAGLSFPDEPEEKDLRMNEFVAKLRSPPQDWPKALKDACVLLPDVLTSLTEVALDGARSSVLAQSAEATFLETEMERVSACCNQICLDASMMNPRWNKAYGKGNQETTWEGDVDDGRPRGGVPYFAPDGWARFALNVCADEEFEHKFKDFGYAYHGTNSRNVGSIMASGLQGSVGCFCAEGETAVYMSPSIEYSGHPRYAKIVYNPELRKYVQCVLQCRVRKDRAWKIREGTLYEDQKRLKGGRVDPNFSNEELEWLFQPDSKDPVSSLPVIKDSIVCTGIMLRIVDDPGACAFWWSESWSDKKNTHQIHVPMQCNYQTWGVPSEQLSIEEPTLNQTPEELLSSKNGVSMYIGSDWKGDGWVAPRPFAEGGMRRAYFAYFQGKYHVLKEFNAQCIDIIKNDLKISLGDAAAKDVCCQLLAISLSHGFNKALCTLKRPDLKISYVPPKTVKRNTVEGPKWYYVEEFMTGHFEKYNSNNGWVSKSSSEASYVAAAFCHYTYCQTKHKAMIVDIQGVGLSWTDPQVHTNVVSRQDVLFSRYSLGNHGKSGMKRFFKTHKCNPLCRALKLTESVAP